MDPALRSGTSFRDFSLDQWVEYTQSRHWRSIDMTLDRVSRVWERLGGKRSACSITVAGTNGKGSTVRMLETVLGHGIGSVGAYTSPHLVRFNERIRINGKEASTRGICEAFCTVEEAVGDTPLTYFEYATLCALWLFCRHSLNVGILEVGMGGRLDAVNMIDSDLAVITSIGLDHEAWLGGDREAIALEKAGVMREGMPVVCSDRNMPGSLEAAARAKAAHLLIIGRDFDVVRKQGALFWHGKHPRFPESWQSVGPIRLPLAGVHQEDNMAGAVAALAILSGRLGLGIADVLEGIGRTTVSGRCQIAATHPLVVVDVAHNADSVRSLVDFLNEHPVCGQTHAVFGALRDKTLDDILQPMLPLVDRWHLTRLEGERGQSAGELEGKFRLIAPHGRVDCLDSPKDAYLSALACADRRDRIVIFGSFHVAGDILELMNPAP